MAITIVNSNELMLNSVRYPLIGGIKPELTSIWPEKLVTGDYTKASDINKDSWVISDQRGGIGIEEMDEQKDADRCWWSTCNLDYRGHIILPPLATAVTIPTISGDDTQKLRIIGAGDNAENTPSAGENYTCVDEIVADDATTYIANTTISTKIDSYKISQGWGSGTITSVKVYTKNNGSNSGVKFYEAVKTHGTLYYGTEEPGRSSFTVSDHTWTTNPNTSATWTWDEIKHLQIGVKITNPAVEYTAQCTQVYAEVAFTSGTTTSHFATFNNELYHGKGCQLSKLDSDGDEFAVVKADFPFFISGLIATENALYILQGDGDPYYWMDAAETCTTTDMYEGLYGIYWDEKLFLMSGRGKIKYSATPNTASPTFTDNGQLPIDPDEIKSLELFYNIDGDDVIYAGTSSGLWVHDYANAKWLQTQYKTPEHDNSSRGLAVWRDGLFVSAGLDIVKYIPAVPTQIISMGLDKEAGMPAEHAGEIVKLIAGYNALYALVDSSEVAGTDYSTIMAYDGTGWQCVYADATANHPLLGGGISSVYAYRFWFDDNGVVSYIPIHRNLRNPLKISTDTHATAGLHITPWFDADWVGSKLALTHELYAGADVSADESIIMTYRLNHTYTDLATGWQTGETISSSGLSTFTFGSSVGTAFKAIQFRYQLARKAADTDETPDILYAVLYYKKVLPKKWGYRFVVDCTHEWHGKSPEQLLDAIITAGNLGTLVQLNYEDTVKYVEIRSVSGEHLTGEGRKGTYNIFCTEL